MMIAALLFSLASGVSADCPLTPAISGPRTACKLGDAVMTVPGIDGATYAWLVDGATIVSGNGTSQIHLALGSGATVKVSVAVSTRDCSGNAETTISLKERFAVKTLASAGGIAGHSNLGGPG